MFEKFGEFDSWEEINRAAEAQKTEGDLEALRELAKENGFDVEDAEDFYNGYLDHFCMPKDTAYAKLRLEAEELGLEREFAMLKEEIEMLIEKEARNDDQTLALGIRRKGKRLAEYLAKVIDRGYEQAITPPKAILDKVTAVPSQYRSWMKTGMPSKAERMEILREYYCGEVTG